MVDLFYHTKIRAMKDTFVALTNHLSNLKLIEGYIPPQFRAHTRSALERELANLGLVTKRSAIRSDSQNEVGLNVPIIPPSPSEQPNGDLPLHTITNAH